MLCEPPESPEVEHAAVRTLPPPASATAEQPGIELPPSVKLSVPVGLLPVTVAVMLTLDPTVEGLGELASVVVVGLPPAVVTLSVSALDVAPVTVMFTP